MVAPCHVGTISADEVRAAIDYDPSSGAMTWRRGRRAGLLAGGLQRDGYRVIRLGDRAYLAHRLAWLLMHGRWPECELDHVNRRRDDNRAANLREATPAMNAANRGVRADNASGTPGVYWVQRERKWRAQIKADGRRKHLGDFTDRAAAIAARQQAERARE